jgi:hypothetical protein
MTRRLMRIAAPLLVCLAALGWVASAEAAKKMEVALYDDNVFLRGLKATGGNNAPFKGLNRAVELHASWIRVNLAWSSALAGKQARQKKQPKKIKYKWTAWNDIVSRARAKGIHVELTLVNNAPAWAAGNHKIGVYKPNPSKFGRFARDAAKHFKSRGVKRYTIGNETNLKVWLAPMSRSPQIYRKLYLAAYKNIKAISKSNQVFIGETAPYSAPRRTIAPLKFLRGVTCVNARYKHKRCTGLKTDGYAHHPYDYIHKFGYKYPGKDNVTLATLGRLTSALKKLRKAKALTTPSGGLPYIYLTEYGYFSGYKYKLPGKTHAKYLTKGFEQARRNPRVKQMLQYLLARPPKKFAFFQTNIMNNKLQPLTPYNALRKWSDNAASKGQIAVPAPF